MDNWDWSELNKLIEQPIDLNKKDQYRTKDISYEKRKVKQNESKSN